jgi:hypothetical protein
MAIAEALQAMTDISAAWHLACGGQLGLKMCVLFQSASTLMAEEAATAKVSKGLPASVLLIARVSSCAIRARESQRSGEMMLALVADSYSTGVSWLGGRNRDFWPRFDSWSARVLGLACETWESQMPHS